MVILPLAIAGVPGVLFARVLRRAGLRLSPAVVLGSTIMPLMIVSLMLIESSGDLAIVPRIPWIAMVVPFLSGVAVSSLYFRRKP